MGAMAEVEFIKSYLLEMIGSDSVHVEDINK